MTTPSRPYIFYDVAISLCSQCFRKIEGKILLQEGKVLLKKRCPLHGWETTLLADDIEYYKKGREKFLKPPEQPCHYNTPIKYGCPYDCGLCPDHEQHSCLSLLEITDACNLRCPVCYAGSGPERQTYRSLELLESMLDAVVRNETRPDVVQISGGEPTLHPQFFEIIDAARRRPIRHLMINTNGIRLANEEGFAERIAAYGKGIEVYMQFDSLRREPLMTLRAADLREVHRRALERCNKANLSVTLVVTVKKGLNDDELGAIIDFAKKEPCVRGVTFQPIQDAGRNENFDPARDRLTLTEVRRKILAQTSTFTPEDILPVPCHPDSLAMAYGLKNNDGELIPISRLIPIEMLLEGRNTIVYDRTEAAKQGFFQLLSASQTSETASNTLKEILCCLPQIEAPGDVTYDKVFRLIIMQFIDVHSFDLRRVKKTCVHIIHPDGRLIPFDTYNLFYRDDLEKTRLAPLRDEILPPSALRRGKTQTEEALG
jgi:uncharacterized radical SAM superfamily Fe-S cluster-containing enzyme